MLMKPVVQGGSSSPTDYAWLRVRETMPYGADHFLETGVDLEIAFSPRRAPGERGWRPVIQAFDPEPRALTAGDLALAAGPTHAARFIELRLSRARLCIRVEAHSQTDYVLRQLCQLRNRFVCEVVKR